MTELTGRAWIWVAGITCCIAGVVYSCATLNGLKVEKNRLRLESGNLEAMRSLANDMNRLRNAKQMFGSLAGKRVTPLKDILAASACSNSVADIKEKESRVRSVDGWFLIQKEVVLNDVKVVDALDFVRKAEVSRPPWMLVKVAVLSSPRDAGTGQIFLTMEALEKADKQD